MSGRARKDLPIPEQSMHRATPQGRAAAPHRLRATTIALALLVALPAMFASACADAPADDPPGLQLMFAALDDACPNTTNGSGSIPEAVNTVAVVLQPEGGQPTTHRKSRSAINKAGFWEISGLKATPDVAVQVYGCDADGKVTWAGRSNGASVVDQKESTVRVFLAPVAKIVCAGGVDAKANDGQGHLYQPVSLAGTAMLDGGDAVITGGLGSWSGADGKGVATFDTAWYAHQAGFFRKGPALQNKRAMHHAHGLDERHVLVVGGVSSLDLQNFDLFDGALLAPAALAGAVPKIAAELVDVGDGVQAGSVKTSPVAVGTGARFLSASIDLGDQLLFVGGVDKAGKGTRTVTRISGLAEIASGEKGTSENFDLSHARAGPALIAYDDGATVVWGGATSKNAADMGEVIDKGAKTSKKLKVGGAAALTGDANLATYGVAAAVIRQAGDKLWFVAAGGQPFAQAVQADKAPAYLVEVDRKAGTATLKVLALSSGDMRGGIGTGAARLPTGEALFVGGLLAKSTVDACTDQPECLINDVQLLSAPADLSGETVTLDALMPSGQLSNPGFGLSVVALPSGVLLLGGQTTVTDVQATGTKALESTGRLVTGAPPADQQAGICGK